jgi:hypothetical protein
MTLAIDTRFRTLAPWLFGLLVLLAAGGWLVWER